MNNFGEAHRKTMTFLYKGMKAILSTILSIKSGVCVSAVLCANTIARKDWLLLTSGAFKASPRTFL